MAVYMRAIVVVTGEDTKDIAVDMKGIVGVDEAARSQVSNGPLSTPAPLEHHLEHTRRAHAFKRITKQFDADKGFTSARS
jgi:hypothetical protein